MIRRPAGDRPRNAVKVGAAPGPLIRTSRFLPRSGGTGGPARRLGDRALIMENNGFASPSTGYRTRSRSPPAIAASAALRVFDHAIRAVVASAMGDSTLDKKEAR